MGSEGNTGREKRKTKLIESGKEAEARQWKASKRLQMKAEHFQLCPTVLQITAPNTFFICESTSV